jgi:multidrug efflux pump subunit AcrA (membrane-fusion protein)
MNKPRRFRILSAFAIASIVVGVALWWHYSLQSADSSDVVTAVTIKRDDLLSTVTATGTLQPSRTVEIKYDTQTIVAQLYVKEGDHVRSGQALATMDTRTLDLQRDQAEQLVKKDQVLVEQAAVALRRAGTLAHDGVIAMAELDTAQANYDSAVHQAESDKKITLQADECIRLLTPFSQVGYITSEIRSLAGRARIMAHQK